VRAVYDTEETKSAGAMNQLIAEKNNPQADVYWANEPIRAEVLRQRNIAAPTSRQVPNESRRHFATQAADESGWRPFWERHVEPGLSLA